MSLFGGERDPWRRRPRLSFVSGALGLLAVGMLGGCAEPEVDPVMDRLRVISDPRGANAVAAMLEAYGGVPAWHRLHSAEYFYNLHIYGGSKTPEFSTRQLHRLGLGEEVQVYVEDLGSTPRQVVRFDAGEIAVTRDGQPISDPEGLEFPLAFSRIIRWSFRTPWMLLDRHSQLEGRAERTPNSSSPVPVGPCDVVRLRFAEPTAGGAIDDWHDFYISQRSHLVEQIHSYRAEDESYRLTIWSDHRTIDGVRVAARRETYSSDLSGAIGGLEAVAEYEDVRFNVPFDAGIFRGAASIAVPGGGETVEPPQPGER
ncbi:MAG TPA: hypothetical protein VFG08_06870 [Candidatus Polarisedimenticolia bacterium]|nr:hypothetical protein [Candidatus Polarisedimenticolia bacterium]